MDVQTAIRQRRSTRRFTDRVVPADQLDGLLDAAAGVERLAVPAIRVTVVSGVGPVAGILSRYAGIYGLVQGAPHLLVGLIPRESERARLDLGYVLEHVVLEATRLGISTCWMTGSYRPKRTAAAIELLPGEVVAATVALGYGREDWAARLHDGAVRRAVSAHRRRPLAELVYRGQWGVPWTPGGSTPYLERVLECAQLAPSATNRQPWRFVVRPLDLALGLVTPKPIDGGIVMAHIALAAADMGQPHRWKLGWRDPELSGSLHLPADVVPVGTFPLPGSDVPDRA